MCITVAVIQPVLEVLRHQADKSVLAVGLQLERHGDVLPRTVAGLDDWGCKYHATPCGRLRWRQCPQVQLPGLEVEELFIHDNKFFRCDGTNYHGALCAAVRMRRAVCWQQQQQCMCLVCR